MILLSTILFFINIIYKYFLKLFLWNILISKIILWCAMFLILLLFHYYPKRQRLRLSYIRKKRYEFPNQYILKNRYDELKLLAIFALYLLLFIFTIFALRVYGINRTVDLSIYYHTIVFIWKTSTYIHIILNVSIIMMGVLIFKKMIGKLLKWFNFYRIKLHLYCVQFDKYTHIFDHFFYYSTIRFYSWFTSGIPIILYRLKLKKVIVKSDDITWDISRKENSTPFEIFLMAYFVIQNYKIHYHILLCTFCLDLIYNNGVIMYTYKILPIIFLYDIWVRLTKLQELTNITYDVALFHLIHIPIIYIEDEKLTFGIGSYERSYNKDYLKNIIKHYVRNDFKDKDIEIFNKNILKNTNLWNTLTKSIYFIYFCIFILCTLMDRGFS